VGQAPHPPGSLNTFTGRLSPDRDTVVRVEIVDQHTHRVLAYVDALNRHGVKPPFAVIDAFANAPDRRSKTVGGLQSATMSRWADILSGVSVPDETFCEYLLRVQWITGSVDAFELTPHGRALLKALNAPALEETTADVFEIVLNPENPFAYAQALGALGSARRALLVEPYFRLEQLMDIAEQDNIERVLVGPNLKSREYDVLATGLAALPETRELTVRKATALHDRYLIPSDEGGVLMLGISLGGIGKKVSTMTTLGEEASMALRATYEAIWAEAELIEPKRSAVVTGEGDVQAPPARRATAAKTTKKSTSAKVKDA